MQGTQTHARRPRPRIPEPVRHLNDALQRGLIDTPGRRCLEAVFGPAETIQLELAVDGLVWPLRAYRAGDDERLHTLRRAAARATFSLRRVTDRMGSTAAPLGPATESVAHAVACADAVGPTGVNIAALLRHIDLHLRIARLWEGETGPDELFDAVGDAPAALRETLADWRRWSDARFGEFECLDRLPDGGCRQLGYRFQGQCHAVHRAGERKAHQGVAWQQLQHNELEIATRALDSWQQLREVLFAAG